MARALVGYIGTNNERVLGFEVARLRRRVAELETELEALRAEATADLHADLHADIEQELNALALT